jgi:hypothetical protein
VSIAGGNATTLDNLDSTDFTLDRVTDNGATTTNAISVGNITTGGYLRGPSTFTIDPAPHNDIGGTLVVNGSLQVNGTTTTINSTTLTVDDKNIELANGSTNAAAADGAGITVDLGSSGTATLSYVSATDRWTFDKNVQAGTFFGALSGNASTATQWQTARTISLTGAVTGSVSINGTSNVSLATSASPTLTLAGDISGSATFSNLNNATLTATVADNSHNHTTLSGVTAINFAANASDTASIETNVVSTTTNLDFKLSDDNSTDKFRWRFTPSGQSEFSAMELRTTSSNTSELTVNGVVKASTVSLGNQVEQGSTSATTTSTSQTTLLGFPAATYGAAKVFVQASQGNFRHITELLVTHNGTTAIATEYGEVVTDSSLFSTNVDISTGTVRVLVTSTSTTSTTYTASYTLMNI